MQFKKGSSWIICHDEQRDLYTAKTWSRGDSDLYEIDAQTFNAICNSEMSDTEVHRLISDGRHLYMHVDDNCGPPYTVVLDEDYADLCPWADAPLDDHVWSAELTDIAVDIFESEANNREQRKKKREARKK